MQGKRFHLGLLAAVFAAFLFTFAGISGNQEGKEKHPAVDYSVSCMECHREVTPEIEKQWRASKHGLMNFGCYICHGDGKVEFYKKPTADRCVSCHSGLKTDYSKTVAKSCFDCHNGHTLKFHE